MKKSKQIQKNTLLFHIKKQRLLRRLLLFFLLTPPANVLFSMAIMSVYSEMNKAESLPVKEDITLHIPGGLSTFSRDWFPFVMTFQSDHGFRSFTGNRNLSLTILYNFPAFHPLYGCSRLYDTSSPYYNSFYGAYFVQDQSGAPFGFSAENGVYTPKPDEISLVPEYDFFELVLSEFGLTRQNAVFFFTVEKLSENVSFAGEEGFFCLDASLIVNGASHQPDGFTRSYLQYGIPAFPRTDALAPVTMNGRIYGKYLEEKNTSLFFYIVAKDREVLERCDQNILQKSKLDY